MRFGRRGKGRNREPIWARREGGKSSAASSASVPTDGSSAPAMDIISDTSDTATQEILTHLGRFSREWTTPENAFWSDACMNQLILCIEIAVEEGWSDLTLVLSDTARILQTYENANRASGAIPFLGKSYDVMCRLVGDIVIEKAPHETLEAWGRVFEDGLGVLERDGLELFQDDGDDMNTNEAVEEPIEPALPMGDAGQDVVSTGPALSIVEAPDRDALPVLDALPPLESLVTIKSEPEPEAESERVYVSEEAESEEVVEDEIVVAETAAVVDAVEVEESSGAAEASDASALDFASFEMPRVEPLVDAGSVVSEEEEEEELGDEETVEAAEPEAAEEVIEVYDPPRIVVDVIDRICDVLGDFESDMSADRGEGLDVLSGGLKALKHEARLMENAAGDRACGAMMDACILVRDSESCWSERFLELGFAFCGIYIEALSEPDGENVVAWQTECEGWLSENMVVHVADEVESNVIQAFPQPIKTIEVSSVDEINEALMPEKIMDTVEETSELVVLSSDDESDDDTLTLFSSDDEETVAPVQEAEVPSEPEAARVDVEQAEEVVEEVDHGALSQALLQSAQEAALQGKGEDAKTFALRAAAEIAMAEVQKAEACLRESEIKLKESMDITAEARTGVKSCEDSVREATALVSESQKTHTEAQKATGGVVKKLEKLEGEVGDLNRQIQELQAKRDEEVERISETMRTIETTRATEHQASNELDELRRLEEDGRARLEEGRQHVKDKQRVVQVIESEMERAREVLTQEKVSHADITQAIQQISGTSIQHGEEGEELLF